MGTYIFLQARMGSTRLPGKALLPIIGKKSTLAVTVERLRRVRGIEKIVILTGHAPRNAPIIEEAKRLGVPYFSGSEENLLDRFYQASFAYKPKTIIRITADCPLIDPGLIARGLAVFKRGIYDLLLNGRTHTFPHGLEYEIFTTAILRRHWKKRHSEFGSERAFQKTFINPTEGIPNLRGVRIKDIAHKPSLRRMRWTLDYPADYALIRKIYRQLYSHKRNFTWRDVLGLMRRDPKLARINERHVEHHRT